MNKTVVAIFNTMDEAQNAADQLNTNGIDRDQVDVSSGKNYADTANDDENGITRFFKNLFGNEHEDTKRYSQVASGGYVVTVHTASDDEAARVSSWLDTYGAIDVDDQFNKNYAGNESTGLDYDNDNNVNRKIPIIEENLQVGKKEVTTGGVRIRSRIVEKPVEETLRLREEHINVQRNKVDRAATDDEINAFRTGTVELKEQAEIADVRKTSRVVEEVSLDKEVSHRDETVKDTVRKTEVDVDDLDADNFQTTKRSL